MSSNTVGKNPITPAVLAQHICGRIAEGAWLAEHVSVLSGIRIGDCPVVGAGLVVAKSLPDQVIALGALAKLNKRFDFRTQTWVPA